MGKLRVKENIFKWLVKIEAISYQSGTIASNQEYLLNKETVHRLESGVIFAKIINKMLSLQNS